MATRIVVDHRANGGAATPPLRHPEKAHRPDNPIQRKPDWIRVKAPTHPVYHETRALMRDNRLVTVCEEAACPNIGECWSQRHATMMIMGDTCTRACSFCNVATGMPQRARRGRAAARRRGGGQARPAPRRRHQRGPRRPAGWRRRAFRAHHPRHPRGRARHHDRGADPRLPPQGRRAGGGGRGPAGRVQPQPGNGAAPLPHHPPRRALLPLAPAAGPREGARPVHLHQVRPDGRAWARGGAR